MALENVVSSNYQGEPNVQGEPDISIQLRSYRVRHVGKLIFATLNINSVRYKCDELKPLIAGNIDLAVRRPMLNMFELILGCVF